MKGNWRAICQHLSNCSANFLSTWLCRHLKQPYVNATLHPDRICWRPALALLHRGHLSSLPNHWERFRGQGRVSYATLTRKLSRDCGVHQISSQVMTLIMMSSQRVHAPCLHWETSLCCSLLTAWSTSCWALHLCPVQMVTPALFTASSLDSFSSNTRRVSPARIRGWWTSKEAKEHSCRRGLCQRSTWSWCAFLDVCVDFLVVWLVRGQCASRSHGLPPSLLLYLLRLPSQHCRVLLRYGLLPGFGSLCLTCRGSAIVLFGRHPTLYPPLMYPQASEWCHILPPACSTCRGTSHCHYQFRSLPCDPSK